MGSAFQINVGYIAYDSHIIVINDYLGYNTLNTPWFNTIRKLTQLRKNTVDIFSHGSNNSPFSIDIDRFEKHLDTIKGTLKEKFKGAE